MCVYHVIASSRIRFTPKNCGIKVINPKDVETMQLKAENESKKQKKGKEEGLGSDEAEFAVQLTCACIYVLNAM